MEAYATIDDLEARWRTLDEGEKKTAPILLSDASAMLASELKRAGKSPDELDGEQKDALKIVCCSMVKRVLAAGDDAADVTQIGVTVGSFSQQRTFSASAGDLYLRDQERRLIGIPKRRMRLGSIRPDMGALND